MKKPLITHHSPLTTNYGFSMVELIISMGIVAIVLSFSVSALIGGRRTQELLTVKNGLVDLIREAKNAALSPEFVDIQSPRAKVIGVNLNESPDTARLIYYLGCGSPCGAGMLIKNKTTEFFGGNIKIDDMYFGLDPATPPSPSRPTQANIFYSIPFAKTCITSDWVVATAEPSDVADNVVDEEYPVNRNNDNPTRFHRCDDASDAESSQLSSYLYVRLVYVGTSLKSTIKINTYSGDVSDA